MYTLIDIKSNKSIVKIQLTRNRFLTIGDVELCVANEAVRFSYSGGGEWGLLQ